MRVPNIGRASNLQLAVPLLNQIIPYYKIEYGQIPDPYPQFDGVTCDDDHISMKLSDENSSFSF
jgi:hypothetical protein